MICAILFICSILLWLFLKKKYGYWKRLGVPFVEPSYIFGNMTNLYSLKNTEPGAIDVIYKRLKGERFCGVYYIWQPALLVLDPEMVKQICITDFEYFENHPSICNLESTDRIVWSLFTLRGREWKERRAVLNASFTPKKLKKYYADIEKSSENLLVGLDKFAVLDEDIELEENLQGFALNVIASTLFGLDTGFREGACSIFLKYSKLIANPSFPTVIRTLLYTLLPSVCKKLHLTIFDPRMWNFFHKFVSEIIEYRERNSILNDDLVTSLLRMKNEDGMTKEEITGHIFAFFVGGYDTSTLALSFTLYELSVNEVIQENVRKEVVETLKKHDGKLSYEATKDMSYMDQVLSETTRKYPILGILKRECSKEYKIPGTDFKIPSGMSVLIPAHSFHHDPDFFPEPNKFDPERFSKESGKANPAYCPFGKGPRMCIGMKLAELGIKVALARLIIRFEFKASGKMVTPIRYDPRAVFVTSRPIDGIWVQIKRRNIRE